MRRVPPRTPSPSRRSFQQAVLEDYRQDLAAWHRAGWTDRPIGRRKGATMLLWFPGLRATLMHRVAHWARINGIPVLPLVLSQANTALHGIELSPTVPIGPGFYLPHTVGSVVHAVRIGANATLQGGITIGARDSGGFPEIGDNVTVGAGARILGPIDIGDNVTVGANAVVVRDVPDGMTMVGIPARPVREGRLD